MDGKPTGEVSPQDPRDGDSPPAAGRPESYGLVELTRLVKDDGRALLVYRRPEER
jgi:hypothetical protein